MSKLRLNVPAGCHALPDQGYLSVSSQVFLADNRKFLYSAAGLPILVQNLCNLVPRRRVHSIGIVGRMPRCDFQDLLQGIGVVIHADGGMLRVEFSAQIQHRK